MDYFTKSTSFEGEVIWLHDDTLGNKTFLDALYALYASKVGLLVAIITYFYVFANWLRMQNFCSYKTSGIYHLIPVLDAWI